MSLLIAKKDYEADYWRALAQTIKPSDCIWDVGANIGYYTTRFADLIGDEGRVVAFEPSQANFERLRIVVDRRNTVALIPLGLSNDTRQAWMTQGDDELGATSKIVGERSVDALQPVRLECGDRLVEQGEVPAPNVIKVDVEGHEYEVIEGLRTTLRAAALRAVFIEMHFSILSTLGRPDAPREIENILRTSGFEIRWTDPSHLMGVRPEHHHDKQDQIRDTMTLKIASRYNAFRRRFSRARSAPDRRGGVATGVDYRRLGCWAAAGRAAPRT